jgi:hypothetical protein
MCPGFTQWFLLDYGDSEVRGILGSEAMHWRYSDVQRMSSEGGDISKRHIETEAEAVAFIVCRPIGLETGNACPTIFNCIAEMPLESLETVRSAAPRIPMGSATRGV